MRLGILGTGAMARQMARATQHVPGMDVAAVLSRKASRAQAFCAECAPGAQGLDDMDAFLAAVDAVYIATPPPAHLEAIKAAVDAKRPVLCEKPLSPSAAETAEIIALSQKAGVLVMEAIWTLTLPAYAALQTLLAPHELSAARLDFDFSYPLDADPKSHYFDPTTGGVLLDRAVYGLAPALHLFGAVRQQDAYVARDAAGLDHHAELRLAHVNGATSTISLSFERRGAMGFNVALPGGLAQLGPNSLTAETLRWTPAPPPGHQAPRAGKPGLIQRLKASPALRRLKTVLDARKGTTHSYGASPYASVLEEFHRTVTSGAVESAQVPLRLSQQIATLVEEARNT